MEKKVNWITIRPKGFDFSETKKALPKNERAFPLILTLDYLKVAMT